MYCYHAVQRRARDERLMPHLLATSAANQVPPKFVRTVGRDFISFLVELASPTHLHN